MTDSEFATIVRTASSPGGMRSLERSLDVLETLTQAPQPQRLTDIANATGLSPATALRILNVLVRRQFVATENQRYRLGVANLATAYAFSRDDALSTQAKPYMQQLAAATHLSVTLQVRYGFQRVQIARVNGKDPLRYELPNGSALPLHLGAGKAFAAYMDRDEFDEFIDETEPDLRTVRGDTFTVEELWQELQEIRARGYHISNQERAIGTRSLAVPLWDASGSVFAILGVLSPVESHDTADLENLVSEMQRAAHAIARLA